MKSSSAIFGPVFFVLVGVGMTTVSVQVADIVKAIGPVVVARIGGGEVVPGGQGVSSFPGAGRDGELISSLVEDSRGYGDVRGQWSEASGPAGYPRPTAFASGTAGEDARVPVANVPFANLGSQNRFHPHAEPVGVDQDTVAGVHRDAHGLGDGLPSGEIRQGGMELEAVYGGADSDWSSAGDGTVIDASQSKAALDRKVVSVHLGDLAHLVLANGERLYAGSELAPGVRLEAIAPDALIFSTREGLMKLPSRHLRGQQQPTPPRYPNHLGLIPNHEDVEAGASSSAEGLVEVDLPVP